MKTYKGLLCSMLATRMLLSTENTSVETPTIQTQPQASEAQSSQEAVIEYEKQLIANAITGTSTPRPENTAQAREVEGTVENQELSEKNSNPEDSSTFASAQKLFNEMWGVKEAPNNIAKTPKEPKVISTKESNPSISSAQIATTLPPNNLIPFAQEKSYAQNPVAGSEVKLPPMPDTLLPMGRPKLVAVAPKQKVKVEPLPEIEKTPNEKAVEAEKHEQELAIEAEQKKHTVVSSENEPQVTVSPFLQWVKENQKSPEIAKEVQDQYKSNEAQKEAARSEDVFLKIRFPYTGAQSAPPTGGAVIYSTPQK